MKILVKRLPLHFSPGNEVINDTVRSFDRNLIRKVTYISILIAEEHMLVFS